MACSAHLLSQSLYQSHRSCPAPSTHLRFQARPAAAASAGVRSRRSPSVRVAASAEQGRKKIELTYDAQAKFNQLADQIDKDIGITRLNLFSPCKINVFLRITGKRPNGFHDLASLFHVVSLGDTIKFSLSPSKSKDRLSTNVAGVPVDESNLIIRALDLYRKKTGTDKHFWIHLDKKVPTGAGLGGGSSNAATALWAANQFSGGIASEKDLQEWSGEIGSDIPFFFSQGAAYCTGRGEACAVFPLLKQRPKFVSLYIIRKHQDDKKQEANQKLKLVQSSLLRNKKQLMTAKGKRLYRELASSTLQYGIGRQRMEWQMQERLHTCQHPIASLRMESTKTFPGVAANWVMIFCDTGMKLFASILIGQSESPKRTLVPFSVSYM